MHNSKDQGIISFPVKIHTPRPQKGLMYGGEWQWKASVFLPLLCPPSSLLGQCQPIKSARP